MTKEFYTEKDIEDLFQRGIRSLQVGENVRLTELAYEKAKRIGMQLISNLPDNPPAAPVRPYLSEARTGHAKSTGAPAELPPARAPGFAQGTGGSDIEKRIREAVIARLGSQVDTPLLDTIIHRVVKSVGLK
jgi:hypothetical protein